MAIEAGTGYIGILPDLTQFSSRLRTGVTGALNTATKSVEPALSRMGQSFTSAGRTMTRSISLPLGVAGFAAGKLAVNFEAAFAKISALSNASAVDVERWRGEVLSLAGETAQAPQELADALFFLASAGLKADQIMPTLAASAKASAAGLGETADIARLTANALNAYAGTGLTAASATDVLVAAVREGTADADEFAGAMGRILPIASRAGVGFDQVAASLAGLSNIGLDVNEGVTAMRGLLQALVAPTSSAALALKDMGISTEDLRATLQEGGILAAVQLLEDATGGNIDKLRVLIPNIRSLTGELALTGNNAEHVADIFEAVNASTGSMAAAFAEVSEGPAFKMQQAIAEIQADAIKLGQKLIPVGQKILDVAGGMLDAFTDLSPATQELAIKAGILAVALGPVVRGIGAIASLSAGAIRVMSALGGASAAAGAGGTTAAVGFGAAAAAAGAFSLAAILSVKAAHDVAVEMSRSSDEAEVWAAALKAGTLTVEELDAIVRRTTEGGFGPFDMASDTELWNARNRAVEELNASMGDFGTRISAVARATLTSQGAMQDWAAALSSNRDITDEQARVLGTALNVLSRYDSELTESERAAIAAFIAQGHFASALAIVERNIQDGLGPLKHLQSAHDAAAEAAADQSVKLQALGSDIKAVEGQHRVGVGVKITGADALATLAARLAALQGAHKINVDLDVHGGRVLAAGGVIAGASGFVTRGPTFLTGESSQMTFAGRGTEAVIPFDDRGIGILAEALRRAIASSDKGSAPRDRPMRVTIADSNLGIVMAGVIQEDKSHSARAGRMSR